MCMSDAAQIVEVGVNGQEATAMIRGSLRSISIALLTLEGTHLKPGDWVLTSTGMAIEPLDEAQAKELLAMTERPEGEAR